MKMHAGTNCKTAVPSRSGSIHSFSVKTQGANAKQCRGEFALNFPSHFTSCSTVGTLDTSLLLTCKCMVKPRHQIPVIAAAPIADASIRESLPITQIKLNCHIQHYEISDQVQATKYRLARCSHLSVAIGAAWIKQYNGVTSPRE